MVQLEFSYKTSQAQVKWRLLPHVIASLFLDYLSQRMLILSMISLTHVLNN